MKLIATTLFLFFGYCGYAQFTAQYFPIGEEPNIRWMSSYTPQESILFEANPTVRFSFFNNIADTLRKKEHHSETWYVAVRPKLRMYTDNSLPVKTPSYRVFFGTQHMFMLPGSQPDTGKLEFISFSMESGHYSNGQSGCAFSKDIQDETLACDSVYSLITPQSDLSDILNRETGNFSTNMTEVILDYRKYKIGTDNVPISMNAYKFGYTLFHDRFLFLGNFGGHSSQDIAIYGRHRLLAGYERMDIWKWKKETDFRISFKQTMEFIADPHEHVNPFRFESMITVYPIPASPAVGFLISYIYGHDNYNYRFVDSGHQVSFGVSWDQFPPFPLMRKNR